MNNFTVGSKVRMNLNKVLSKVGEIPPWYTNQIFTVKKIIDHLDNDNFKIIEVTEPIPNSSNKENAISTIYLDNIKYIRKTKLEKLNEK